MFDTEKLIIDFVSLLRLEKFVDKNNQEEKL